MESTTSLPSVNFPKTPRIKTYRKKWLLLSLLAQIFCFSSIYLMTQNFAFSLIFLFIAITLSFYWDYFGYPEKKQTKIALWLLIHPHLLIESTSILFTSLFFLFLPFYSLLGLFKVISFSLLIALFLSLFSYFFKKKKVKLTEYKIALSSNSPKKQPLKILQISDLHMGNLNGAQWIEKQCSEVMKLSADLIVLTGDFIMFGSEFIPDLIKSLSPLKAHYGVFAVLGNHDYFTNTKKLIAGLERIGIHVLMNESIKFFHGKREIELMGLTGEVDSLAIHKKNLSSFSPSKNDQSYRILLVHDPLAFKLAEQFQIDLVLSGHTHGGQIACPRKKRLNLASLKYPYTYGHYIKNQSHLIVSSGVGTTHHLSIRIGTSPEVVQLILN